MQIRILEDKIVEVVESKESFKKSIYHAPSISLQKHVKFMLNSLSFNVKFYLDNSRPVVSAESLVDYQRENNYANITPKTILLALAKAKNHGSGKLYEAIMPLKEAEKDDETLLKCIDMIKEVKGVKVLNDEVSKPYDINEFRTYLWYTLCRPVFEYDTEKSTEEMVREYIAHMLFDVLRMSYEKYNINDVAGAIKYLLYLNDLFCLDIEKATRMLCDDRKIVNIIENQDDDDLVAFLKLNIKDDSLIDEALAQSNAKSIKELIEIYRKTEYTDV